MSPARGSNSRLDNPLPVVAELPLGALRAEHHGLPILVKVGPPASRPRVARPAALRALQVALDVDRVWHGYHATRRRPGFPMALSASTRVTTNSASRASSDAGPGSFPDRALLATVAVECFEREFVPRRRPAVVRERPGFVAVDPAASVERVPVGSDLARAAVLLFGHHLDRRVPMQDVAADAVGGDDAAVERVFVPDSDLVDDHAPVAWWRAVVGPERRVALLLILPRHRPRPCSSEGRRGSRSGQDARDHR